MPTTSQVLFIQGGGARVHDAWDELLVESLRERVGDTVDVRYPQMPDEADPSYETWAPEIQRELAGLDKGAVAIGHSVGGALLLMALSEMETQPDLGAIVLLASPYVGPGGWSADVELPDDVGNRLPVSAEVHVFHGLQDKTVLPTHAAMYAGAIPQAQLHLLPGRDHDLGNDLTDVAELLGAVRPAPAAR